MLHFTFSQTIKWSCTQIRRFKDGNIARACSIPRLGRLQSGLLSVFNRFKNARTTRSESELIEVVKRTFQATPAVTLNMTFLTIQFVMENIIKHDGPIDFSLGHLIKDESLGSDEPLTIFRSNTLVHQAVVRI